MYYPLTGERVWLSGCRNEYIVERTDYTAFVAALALVSDRGIILEGISFRLLFAQFEVALGSVAGKPIVREILCSSQLCLHRSRIAIRDIRETTRATFATIRRTQALISDSDRDIARWKACGYAYEQETI